MIDKARRAVTPLIIHSCFKKSGFPSPNLVDVDDTLTEFNAEPSLWEALPEQDLTFDDYVLVDTDIAVWGALSDAEIVALDHNNTESDEDESEELTPVTQIKSSLIKTKVQYPTHVIRTTRKKKKRKKRVEEKRRKKMATELRNGWLLDRIPRSAHVLTLTVYY
ncbi:hypothetical protein TNCT_576051 [Trichonephila clavata]|uniref:Uncharacterized protein n=1 Tax=Trichonephila clavata TaxID=2740835 RepID=A0A8X6GB24_TRICU|nr:hypothetical protein TNCT_576051 [Trichonephila clavata]